jgi:hypothetical protein
MVNPHAAAYSYGRSTPSSKKAYRTVLFTVNQTPRGQCSTLTHPGVFGNEGLLLFASTFCINEAAAEPYFSSLWKLFADEALGARDQEPASSSR